MYNPHAKKMLTGGSISTDPMQKNKSRAPRKRIMKNRHPQNTRHVPGPLKIPKTTHGYYPLYGED